MFKNHEETKAKWVESSLRSNTTRHESFWSESLAVGPAEFVDQVRAKLGAKVYHPRTERISADTFSIQDKFP